MMTGGNEPDATDALHAALGADRVMAILRYHGGGDLGAAVDALCEGGIRVLEATADTPGVWDAVAAIDRPGVLVGVGTVVTVDEVERAADAGARFVVSPGLVLDVVAAAHDLGLAALPGVATGTEVLAAKRAGARLLKLFPAAAMGVAQLRALRGPFADTTFVPTGGIGPDDVATWLAAGAHAVALGSDLAGRTAPTSSAEAEVLTRRAGAALAAARQDGPA